MTAVLVAVNTVVSFGVLVVVARTSYTAGKLVGQFIARLEHLERNQAELAATIRRASNV